MEVHDNTEILYETLGPLSNSSISSSPPPSPSFSPSTVSSNPNSPERYSVFRTQIPSSSLSCLSSATAAPDYFSLDFVDANNDILESRQPFESPPSAPPGSASIQLKETVLERGWFQAGRRFKSPMLQLHKEILDFCDFLSPTQEEQSFRNAAVEGVFDCIKYIWPHCEVEVFGSFKTGLYLPTSDIDVVILDSKVRTPQIGLQALSRALSQKGIAKKIQVIAKARVPIVKFIEKRSNIAFDISFDVQNGPKAAEFIKDAVTKIPPLRPLCLILKVFLQQRELNEVYSGGIGSYALLTMLIAQLQIHWKGQYFQGPQASLEHNLGVLLINFFEFYGRKLNVWDVGVSCKESGTFYLKNTRGFLNSDRPFLLSIEDPQASENDIGRSSFNYSQIRSAFGMAFSTLTSSKTILGLGVNKSILGTIIRPDPILLERKGGLNGDVTFDKLLPGAGEVVQTPFQDEQGSILCNWQFNEDEPFPRSNGNLGEVSTVHSSRKRKKEKRKSSLKESNEHMKIHGEENGSSKKGKKKKSAKKRWKNHNDEQVFGGISHVNGPPWTRSCSR